MKTIFKCRFCGINLQCMKIHSFYDYYKCDNEWCNENANHEIFIEKDLLNGPAIKEILEFTHEGKTYSCLISHKTNTTSFYYKGDEKNIKIIPHSLEYFEIKSIDDLLEKLNTYALLG